MDELTRKRHALPAESGLCDRSLTPRQLEVLLLLQQGLSNKEICRTLGLSLGTVKAHVSAVLLAYNARRRSDLPNAHMP